MDNKSKNQKPVVLKEWQFIIMISVIVLIIILAIGLTIWDYKKNQTNVIAIDKSMFICQQDSDCVLIPKYKNCCLTCGSEAVTTKSKELIVNQRVEKCKVFRDALQSSCPEYKCQNYDYQAVCEQNTCVTKKSTTNPGNNVNKNSDTELLTGVYLEKHNYKLGENVIGVVRNSTDPSMFVKNISVEFLSGVKWKVIKNNTRCHGCADSVKCEGGVIGVQPHDFKEFSWDQSIDEIDVSSNGSGEAEKPACRMATAGRYRITVAYYRYNDMIGANQSSDSLYLYSEEFSIL